MSGYLAELQQSVASGQSRQVASVNDCLSVSHSGSNQCATLRPSVSGGPGSECLSVSRTAAASVTVSLVSHDGGTE